MATDQTTLRQRQTAAAREEILDVAMKMLTRQAAGAFSHESIAAAAGMGTRTVYRHFPDRGQLLQALWLRMRDQTQIKFPIHEEEIISLARIVFQSFDKNQLLVRAVLNSSAGMEVRERGSTEGHRAFAQSLSGLLGAGDTDERARIIAVFLAIYSAPFWQLLRDRGGLTGPQAQDAVGWLMEVLLDALRSRRKGRNHGQTPEKKRQNRTSRR